MSYQLPITFQDTHGFEPVLSNGVHVNYNFLDLKLSVLSCPKTSINHAIGTLRQSTSKMYVLLGKNSDCVLSVQDDLNSINEENRFVEYHILLQDHAKIDFQLSLLTKINLSLEIHVYLEGSSSRATINGVYALDFDQKVSIKTFQNHIGEMAKSELLLKGMLKGRAQAFYEGLIFIGPEARKTQASQENKNILLSKQAQVISIPSIKVLQHDVQCSHGSAIGRFEKEQLWYLQSKGLEEVKAHKLLISSFFASVIENFKDKDLLEEAICQKMV